MTTALIILAVMNAAVTLALVVTVARTRTIRRRKGN